MTEDRNEDLVRRAFLGEGLSEQEQRDLNGDPELQARLESLQALVAQLDDEGAASRENDLRSILLEDPDAGEEAVSDALRTLMQGSTEPSDGKRLRLLTGGLVAAAAAVLAIMLSGPSDTPADPGSVSPGEGSMVLLGDEDFTGLSPVGDTRLPLTFEFEYTGESSSMVEFGVVIRGLPELDSSFELESKRSDSPSWTPNELERTQLPDSFLWFPVVYDDGDYEEGPPARVRLLRD